MVLVAVSTPLLHKEVLSSTSASGSNVTCLSLPTAANHMRHPNKPNICCKSQQVLTRTACTSNCATVACYQAPTSSTGLEPVDCC